MKKGLSEKPVLFLILLLIAAFALTAVFVIIFQMIGLEGNLATSVARILAAVMLMILFRNCFPWPNSFRGVRYIIPALIIVVWNVLYNYLSHSTLKPMAEIPGIVLAALAPAMFEESIFRMIGFKKMEDAGRTPTATVISTALIFGLIHLTNIVGGDVLNTLIQTAYATAVGILFGGIYAATKDPASMILLHFLTDFSSQIFQSSGSPLNIIVLILFVAVLGFITYYGMMLTKQAESAQ
ncbi:MAG: CPBP family intramembrane metalloprotease [Solobacterium sp.]|nr:CPBP family intramembrane metalloprotease [Solobacterium sp.]